MPYVTAQQRQHLQEVIDAYDAHLREVGDNTLAANCGELNYLITMMLKSLIAEHGESYAVYNALIGALECCKQEFYRRKAGLYEDSAVARNGDVW